MIRIEFETVKEFVDFISLFSGDEFDENKVKHLTNILNKSTGKLDKAIKDQAPHPQHNEGVK